MREPNLITRRIGTYHWCVSEKTLKLYDYYFSKHPYIYTILLDLLARYQIKTGQRECSITLLWNQMRWELQVNIGEHEDRISDKEKGLLEAIGGYKFNDNVMAGYARAIMANNPNLAGVFEIRCPNYCLSCPPKKNKAA